MHRVYIYTYYAIHNMQHLVFHNFLINLYTDLRIVFVSYITYVRLTKKKLYNNTPNVLTFQHYYMYLFTTTTKKNEHVRAGNIDCCIRWRLCHRLGVFDIDKRTKYYIAMFLIKGG